jgi:photosystem II stability/assembly factor-like uncharacterized protein
MKSKIYILSLLLITAALFAFITKADFKSLEKKFENGNPKEKYERENEPGENEEAELNYKRVTLVSPEKQNQIWSNLDAMHRGSNFKDDKMMMPWAPIGPSGIRNMYSPDYLHKYSGRCMMVDFDRNNNFWIGSAHGGLWAGPYILYPIPLTDALNSQKIGAFATHPAHDSDYYVGTGLFRPGDDDPGTGLWRCTGNGSTFIHQNLPDPNISWFSSIKFHRTNPAIVLAASSNGLFRTSDDGNTWNKIIVGDTNGEPSQRISDLQVDPSDPNIMYTIRNSYFLRGGMFKSTNAGVNWTALPIGVSNIGNSKISICRDFPNIIYVNITSNSGWATVGVSKSTNAGASWVMNTGANSILGNQGFNNCGISVCPNDPNTVLAGGQFMARSTNGGTAWTAVDGQYVHADVTSFAWKNNNEVWSTSDGGIFKSVDKGLTWTTPDNIMFVSEIFFLAISPSLEIDQAMGLEHNGVCVTHLGGSDYRMTLSGDGSGVAFDPFNTQKVYSNVGFYNTGGLPFRWFKSTSGGDYETWDDMSSNISNPCGQWYQCVKTDKQSPVNIYTNVCGTVWRSNNEGSSWTNLNCPTAPGANIDRMITVTDNGVVFVCPSDTGGNNSGKLLVFSGGTWSDRTPPGVGKTQIERVRVQPRSNSMIYALTSGTNSTGKKVFRSTNTGLNWTNITGTGLDDVPLSDITPHPTDPNRLYIGTQGFGFFGTTNGGVNWYPWNNGLPKSIRVSEMAYIDSGFVSQRFLIYAATFGRGIYVRDLADDPSGIGNNNTSVKDYSLRQNYPNPFNPMTTIEFNMKKAGVAKMEVYDINGRLISTLFDAFRQEGKQFVKFSGYDLPSGVYFYRFSSEGFVDTKKMMIVK